MNNILVTGASGFIGQYLIKYLISSGFRVRVLLRKNSQKLLNVEDVDIYRGDITQPESLIGVCESIDTVLHLAGYAHAMEDNAHEAERHHQINFLGTEHLVKEALRAKVARFVYLSSVKAADVDEKKMNPSPYACAKRAAEETLLRITEHTPMHVCILRPVLVYGAQVKGNLASMLRAIDKGRFLPLPATRARRSLVSVHDISMAILLAATRPIAHRKTYIVTDGQTYSAQQIAKGMFAALNKSAPAFAIPLAVFKLLAIIGSLSEKWFAKRLPFNRKAYAALFHSAVYDSSSIQKELNFTPRDQLESVLPEMVQAYHQEEMH